MTIGIDIRILGKGRRTGVEDYTINLLSSLLLLDKSTRYRLFYNGFKKPKLDYPFLKFSNVKIKKFRIPNRILDLFLRFLRFPKIDKLLGPPAGPPCCETGEAGKVDIFLSPHFLLAPVSKRTKTIVIFYDLSFVRFPEFFSLPKLLWHKFIYPKKQAQKADLIVAISESTKEDLINLYGVKEEKIMVIYPGIDKKFRPIEKDNPDLDRVRKKYELPDNPPTGEAGFILYFGTIEPRKNVLGLIKAFEQLKRASHLNGRVEWLGFEGRVRSGKRDFFDFPSLKLVIAGIRGWLYDEVFERIEKSQFKKDIIFTDFIDEEDKPYLYNLAQAFIYPSFFEGFGLPPLEAMACGVPTIVSNKSSLPEVVGQGAIMINPYNVDEISFAIKEVLENKDLREYLIKRGLERVESFNWDKTAKEFLKLFKAYENRN